MTEEKGLKETAADKLGEHIQLSGQTELIERLLQDELVNKIPSVLKGLEELKLLLNYCNLLGIQNNVILSLSLARGLDYYTGAIFEAVLQDKQVNSSIGSIAAGGRYDNLINMFEPKHSAPCVGISIGIERILSLLQSKYEKSGVNLSIPSDVYVISAHKGLHEDRMKVINRLWAAGIRSEHSFKENPRILHQMQHCEKHSIPYAIIIGEAELQRNVVKVRKISTREEFDVPMDNLENEIKNRIAESQE